jgi:hypothetical protein
MCELKDLFNSLWGAEMCGSSDRSIRVDLADPPSPQDNPFLPLKVDRLGDGETLRVFHVCQKAAQYCFTIAQLVWAWRVRNLS